MLAAGRGPAGTESSPVPPRAAPAPAAAPGLRARVRERVPTGPATRSRVAAAALRPPGWPGAGGAPRRRALPGGRLASP